VGAVLSLAHLEEPFAVASGRPSTGVFHAVLSGSAWARTVDAEPPVQLVPGQVAIFPSGAEHVISSNPEPTVAPVPVSASGDGPVPTMRVENGGPLTEILCGTITFDESPIMSVAGALPDMVVTGRDGSADWVRSTVELMAEELHGDVPASDIVAARLADVLVVRALREMVGDGLGVGWAAGLQDPQLAHALAAIHGDPSQPWTAASLARLATMSRSSFYERFTDIVGTAPGEYLARWRIHLACSMLRDTPQPVSAVARAVGFTTDAGFSTAFKRLVGTAPSTYRRQSI
jgi:AraC-like DNA-binding protein